MKQWSFNEIKPVPEVRAEMQLAAHSDNCEGRTFLQGCCMMHDGIRVQPNKSTWITILTELIVLLLIIFDKEFCSLF